MAMRGDPAFKVTICDLETGRELNRNLTMAKQNKAVKVIESVDRLIRTVRGERVILDSDLARIYDVETRALNQGVRRNIEKFPPDFLFQLTREEAEAIRRSRSQTVILKRGQNVKFLPYAFTEHGAIMAANVLNSPQAVQMSVFVVRAFVKMRGVLSDTRALAKKLAKLEAELKSRLDVHDVVIVEILQRVMDILDPPPQPELPKREIGFHVKETRESGTKEKTKR